MSTERKARGIRARASLLAALALLFGTGVGGIAVMGAQGTPKGNAEKTEQAPYKSSIQVADDDKGEGDEAAEENEAGEKNEASEGNEANEADEASEANEQSEAVSPKEQAEAARYQSLARITSAQAGAAAIATVPGSVGSVELENEDGNLVYGVTVKTTGGERDVKVDAGNGKVLHVEQDEKD